MLKKVILCPNPYRDHELTVAKEAKRILDSVHCPNVVCVPFRNEEKPEGYGLDIRPLQQELRGADMIIAFGGDGVRRRRRGDGNSRRGLRLALEPDGAALASVMLQIALFLQIQDMEMRGGRGLEIQLCADLAHRGRIAPLGHELGDVIVDLLLHFGQFFHGPLPPYRILSCIIAQQLQECNDRLSVFWYFFSPAPH